MNEIIEFVIYSPFTDEIYVERGWNAFELYLLGCEVLGEL